MLRTIQNLFSILFLFFVIVGITSCSVHSPNRATTNSKERSSKQALRIGVSTNAPPLIYKKGGKLQGLEIDFAHQLADYLGKKPVFVELPWEKQIPSLENGDIDIIMSGMTITGKRAYRVNFSEPYFNSGQLMLIRMEDKRRFIDGIYSVMGSNHTVGIIKGTTGDFYVTQTLNRIKTKSYSTSKRGVEALIKKDIDVLIYDAPMVCHYAAIYENAKLAPILNLLTSENLAWAVNKNDVNLLNSINDFITVSKETNRLQQTISNRIPYL